MKIPGYLIPDPGALYESDTSVVYRAIREGDNLPVIIKMLNKEYPSIGEINRFSHEFKILRGFDSEGIIRVHGLEKHQNTRVMVLEDFGGESLARILPARPPDMKTFLALAIKITGILGTIHQRNIIHKDLNPNNILWNPETDQVKIIDFSLSTELSMETPELKNLNVLEGTLPYMSPEQTGRMNRSLDYLTDFYSLGVTFYEMLTRARPFQTLDPMELVYSHIAKTPASPREYNLKIPEVVSAIIMKLMSKVAEERYHSASGLKHDLEKCLDQYLRSGTILPFDIGVKDYSEKFTIPQALYGREHEIEQLLSAYQRVCLGKKELMLVAGTPGVGKSALVNEIHKPITGNRAYFISGKFGQFQRNIPYAPLIQAFQGLIRQILTQKAAEIKAWKESLEKALGANAQVIIEVIPEVERITGRQPSLPELAPSEAQHRFNISFLNFVRVFTGQGRPLVLFLDDVQWADLPSLKLIELIMCDRKRKHIFLIVSYRDTEVDRSHPLMLTVEEIRKTGIGIHTITLKPLKLEHVCQIIGETVGKDRETTLPLSELCLEKTRGNPFFLRQFLLSLHHEHFIEFNRQETRWQWDLQRIKDAEITDNVVALLIGKIHYLPANTQQVLKLASVIGATFDLNTLAVVHEKKPLETAEDVWPALKEGLVITSDEAYGFMEDVDAGDTMSYRFLHDRVQQAAYSLIDEDKKTEAHLKIGRLLLNSLRESEPDDLLFDMANHLNLGKSLITDPRERIRLIGMNLRAGIKAKSSAAYAPSLAYLQEGIDLLGKDGWTRETCDLSLQLYTEATEAAYLNADFSEMNRMADETLRHASRITETVKIYETRIQAFRALNRNIEAVDTTYDVLRLLTLKLPQKITLGHLALALIKTRLAYAGKKKKEILSLPEMTDPSSLAIVRIATSSATALFSSGHDKEVGLLVLKLLNLFLKRGNAGQSAYWYSLYGMVLCSFNAFDLGNHFGSIASELMNRPNAKAIKSRVMFIVNIFIFHWKNHLRSTLPPLIEAYQLGYETGDIEFIAWNGYTYCMHSYFCGRSLQELDREMARYGDVMERYKQESVLNYTRVFRQAVLNLQGKSDNPMHLKGESYDEDVMKEAHVKAKDRTGSYAFHMHKLILCYLFEDYKAAEEHAAMAKKYLNSVTTLYAFLEFYFYRALIRLATLGDAPAASRKKKLKKIDYSLNKLKKWAELAPMNNRHKYDLVMAEKARVEGHRLAALDFYKAAIKGARENRYLQEEAMASERVARYYLEQGFDREAEAYIREARYLYQQWGALAKVAHLDRKFPDLFFRGLASAPDDNGVLISHPKVSREPLGSENIDLGAVMKATQAISGEIDLESLISKLMAIIIENAGAERGFLIIRDEKTERLLIRAEKTATSDDIRVLIPEDVEGCRRLSQNMVHYAFHAQAEIVLHDATRDGDFTGDVYVTRERPKSILCFPIVRHGKSMGIIYLENNLTAGAFTTDRLKVLQILSSQASISLANAELYDGMKESEKNTGIFLKIQPKGFFISPTPAGVSMPTMQGPRCSVTPRRWI